MEILIKKRIMNVSTGEFYKLKINGKGDYKETILNFSLYCDSTNTVLSHGTQKFDSKNINDNVFYINFANNILKKYLVNKSLQDNYNVHQNNAIKHFNTWNGNIQ